MASEKEIIKALEKVIHPERKKNIIELGIVSEVVQDKDGIIITIVPERSNDPFINSLKSSVTRVLKEELGNETIIKEIKIQPRTIVPKQVVKPDNNLPGVKNIVAISSGKGGVGKTTIAVNLTVALARKGYKTGLLDADIFGPSVPIMFDASDYKPEVRREANSDKIIPLQKYGVKVLSIGFFVDPADAVVWRGPMASNFLKQLITQGDWGELDFLLVDLPPGTSDIHLTLVQEVSVTGSIVVSTPQAVALADAIKGISMFRSDKINVPVLGLVENMSWFTPEELPNNKYYIFGREGCKKLAEEMDVPLLGQIPVVQSICEGSDNGNPVALEDSETGNAFALLADNLIEKINLRNRDHKPTERVKMS